MVWLAQHTLAAVNAALLHDSGASFRQWEGRVLPHMGDAYRGEEDSHRTHLGASTIGGKCERAIYYGWRWALSRPPRGKKDEPKAQAASRMYRLWNRGHLEEGRFIAMLLAAGIQVYQQDEHGNQFRIYAFGGHFAGSTDGVLLGVPDLPPGVPALAEFKTHSEKSFTELESLGVREAKPEHFAQMQSYMSKMGLVYALYLAVNKNTEALYAEIVQFDPAVATFYLERARRLVFATAAPDRIRGASPGFHVCKYLCDYTDVCFGTVKPDRNCRTCVHAHVMEDGGWCCGKTGEVLDKAAQLAGCTMYELNKGL
jgi:hypothetical protein